MTDKIKTEEEKKLDKQLDAVAGMFIVGMSMVFAGIWAKYGFPEALIVIGGFIALLCLYSAIWEDVNKRKK